MGLLRSVFTVLFGMTTLGLSHALPASHDLLQNGGGGGYGKQVRAGYHGYNDGPEGLGHDKGYDYQKDSKYYYGGQFKDACSGDGLYYKDDATFVMCSNGYPHEQPCPPGTKTSGYPSYKPGYYYGYTDLCSVNLVDYGLSAEHYAPIGYGDKDGYGKKESHERRDYGYNGGKERLEEYKDKQQHGNEAKNVNKKEDYYHHQGAASPSAAYNRPSYSSVDTYSSGTNYPPKKDLYAAPSLGGAYPAINPYNHQGYPSYGAYSPVDHYSHQNPYGGPSKY